ncbi:hypothetical protein FRC03_000936 [Tulasnella sp. 419]|nr:hypothetical protein FRC03_000936 [Tulasnella sp. 419]
MDTSHHQSTADGIAMKDDDFSDSDVPAETSSHHRRTAGLDLDRRLSSITGAAGDIKEGPIRASFASSSTSNNSMAHRSRQLYAQSESSEEEEDRTHDETAPSGRDSATLSDGGFGIGMQFIQGLIDENRVSNTTMSVAGGSSALGLERRNGKQRRSSASEWSEESFGKPAWRRSSISEEFSGGLAALGRTRSNASKASKKRASSRASKKSRARSEEDADADAEETQDEVRITRRSTKGSRASSRKSSLHRETGQPFKGLRRSMSAKSLSTNPNRPVSPISQRSLRPRSVTSLRSTSRLPVADPDFDTNSLRSGSASITNTRSSGSHNHRHLSQSTTHGNHFVFDTDYDPPLPPPLRAGEARPSLERPSLEAPSGSDSEDEGYYEQYGDIYDNYRYSRFSVYSRKSRKSVLPPPARMPTSDSMNAGVPSPPVPSTSGFMNNIATPPRAKSKLNNAEDEVRSIHSSPGSMNAVPRFLNFGDVEGEMNKSSVGRGGSKDSVGLTTLEPSPMTTSPVVGSNAAQFASSLRSVIAGDENDDDPQGDTATDHVDGRKSLLILPLSPINDDTTESNPLIVESPISEDETPTPLGPSRSSTKPLGSIPPPLVLTPSAERSFTSSTLEVRLPPLSPQEAALQALEGRSPRSSVASPGLFPPSPISPNPDMSGESSPPYRTPTGRPLTFLPHPGAPLPRSPSRPSIHAPPPAYTPPRNEPPPLSSLYNVMAMAAAHSRGVMANNGGGSGRLATIHGRTLMDLASATGPVMINWIVDREGRGAPVPPPPPLPTQQPQGGFQRHANTLPTSSRDHPSQAINASDKSRSPTKPLRPMLQTVSGDGVLADGQVLTMSPRQIENNLSAGSAPGTPIPRANFFPKAGQPRPRSRSFCDLNASGEVQPAVETSVEGSNSSVPPLRPMKSQQGSMSTSEQSSSEPKPLVAPLDTTSLPSRSPKPPSPLLLSRVTTASNPSLRSPPSSPLAHPPMSPGTFVQATSPLSNIRSIRPTPSVSSLQQGPGHGPSMSLSSPRLVVRNVASTSVLRTEVMKTPMAHQAKPSSISASNSPASTQRNITPSEEIEASTPPTKSTPLAEEGSPKQMTAGVGRSSSLRSKISLSALRSKAGKGTKDTPELGISTTPGAGPSTPNTQYEFTEETVQVKEGGAAAEFELIRPVIARVSMMRHSEDSGSPIDRNSLAKERLSITSEVTKTDGESYRSASPVISSLGKQPTIHEGVEPENEAGPRPPSPMDAAAAQAHRARELKWISTMGNTPAASAKKSKKIKKLVQEGVPPSVRSVVWLYLTDTKSRRMDGLYTGLCGRGSVAASPDIERDVERIFFQHPHLRDPKGPITSLLQAYLHMVPDVKYQRGLTVIAGTILLQSPEEDAFWTFLALMDNHLRGYFAQSTTQMDVDAQLFMRAVETADPPLAKRLFAGLGVRSVELCRLWFTSLFAEALPPKYLYRVWDLFICEGVIFLFRVGLSILHSCRRHIMETQMMSGSDAIAYLSSPPSSAFSADPDAFIGTALGVKLKEDDLRKAKVKIETTLRHHHQSQAPRPSIAGKEFRTLKKPSS